MLLALGLLGTLSIISLIGAAFFGTELLKKFSYLKAYTDRLPEERITRVFCAGQAVPGMVVVQLTSPQPFRSLIAFELAWRPAIYGGQGTDHYGYVIGLPVGDHYEACFATYLGRGTCSFVLPHTGTSTVTAQILSFSEADTLQCHIQKRCEPHWYQRLGFYS